MVHQKKPQRMLRLFCCTIPFGTDSHFAQALVFVSRGLVAKNGCGFVKQGPRLSVSESGERTIWDVVEKLPHGMDTVLGDGGIRLSGGERQRVVLARVLLGNPKLIVMNNALPYLTTDLTNSEILSLAYRLLPLASSISISSHTVPASDCYYSANIRGMSVLVPDLPLIRQRLEEYLPLE